MAETQLNRIENGRRRQIGLIGTIVRIILGLGLLAYGLSGGKIMVSNGQLNRVGRLRWNVRFDSDAFPVVVSDRIDRVRHRETQLDLLCPNSSAAAEIVGDYDCVERMRGAGDPLESKCYFTIDMLLEELGGGEVLMAGPRLRDHSPASQPTQGVGVVQRGRHRQPRWKSFTRRRSVELAGVGD